MTEPADLLAHITAHPKRNAREIAAALGADYTETILDLERLVRSRQVHRVTVRGSLPVYAPGPPVTGWKRPDIADRNRARRRSVDPRDAIAMRCVGGDWSGVRGDTVVSGVFRVCPKCGGRVVRS